MHPLQDALDSFTKENVRLRADIEFLQRRLDLCTQAEAPPAAQTSAEAPCSGATQVCLLCLAGCPSSLPETGTVNPFRIVSEKAMSYLVGLKVRAVAPRYVTEWESRLICEADVCLQ